MLKRSIQFGSKEIVFELEFSERKTLGITVHPEMDVLVKAPFGSNEEEILARVRKRAPWILKQQYYFLGFFPKMPERRYISGETHYYLGRQYLLKVKSGIRSEVNYKGKEIEIVLNSNDSAEKVLKSWYKEKAKLKFAEIAAPLIERFKKYNVTPSGVFLQEMSKRWGSCTPKGKIILNPELIKAPKACIEYVIVHELCHLVHHNHTQKFMDLQSKEMPDWEKWKNKLEKLLA